MRVEFFPAAEQELTEAAEYYEARHQGLGTNFLAEIERTCAVLVELPALGEKLDPTHPRLPLRRFPYELIFRLMVKPYVLWRLLIVDGSRAIGRHASQSPEAAADK